MSKILSHFPKRLKPREVQKNALLALEQEWNNGDIFVINLPVACHKIGQKVLMYDGSFKKIEEIRAGDKLMGPDSSPRLVEKTHLGRAPLFKIVPKRGQEWTVTGNHILRLWRYVRESKQGKRVGKFVHEEITVNEYIKKSKDYKNNSWMQRVGADFPTKEHKIPAYILGLWLGDGTSYSPALTSMDKEIVKEWISYSESFNGLYIRVEQKENNKAATYHIVKGKGQKNPVFELLRELNVYKNKHIPKEYLTGNRKQRLELLAGLIDTDGHVDRLRSSIEITQVNKHLADDILYLARSLGYSASQHVKIINEKEYYRCHISGQTISEIPVRLKYKTPKDSISNQNNYKFDIIPVEEGNFAGVTVDKDNLYLLDDFTISHNSGKSAISLAISSWVKKASIITPTKLLVQQYKDEYPFLQQLKAKSDYWCETFKGPISKRPKSKDIPKLCSKDLNCSGCNEYRTDLRKARVMPYLLSNYYIYLAHQLYRPTLIVDEAHCLIDTVKQMASKKFWHHKHGFPTNMKHRDEIKEWVNSLEDFKFTHVPELKLLKDELNSFRPKYLVSVELDTLRGEEEHCIKMLPLDVSDAPPIMWPKQVKKIVLLSATLSRKDIEQLGLSDRRIKYIEADSPIDAQRRPVVYPNNAVNMSYRYQDANTPKLCNLIEKLAATHKDEKGLIHATYGLAKKLRNYPWPDEIKDRLIFHTAQDKSVRYQEFRESEEPKILVASGMYEGIDLPYDAGRWQVLAKIPWPSLGDPAIKYMCDIDGDWYVWETIKSVLQACGRICRTLDDYGITYVLDSSFKRVYTDGVEKALIPKWFQDAVKKRWI